MDFYKIKKVSQPSNLKINLFSHQLASIYNMEKFEAENITKHFFNKKGFDIYCVGQRLSKEEIFSESPKSFAKNFSFIEYFEGNEKTIVSSNFAFHYFGFTHFSRSAKDI